MRIQRLIEQIRRGGLINWDDVIAVSRELGEEVSLHRHDYLAPRGKDAERAIAELQHLVTKEVVSREVV